MTLTEEQRKEKAIELGTRRQDLGETLDWLGDKLAVHPTTIWKWENEKTLPPEAILREWESIIRRAETRKIARLQYNRGTGEPAA